MIAVERTQTLRSLMWSPTKRSLNYCVGLEIAAPDWASCWRV